MIESTIVGEGSGFFFVWWLGWGYGMVCYVERRRGGGRGGE